MILKHKDLEILADIAEKAAREAGELIQSFRSKPLDIHYKPTGTSPSSQIVTQVDLKSQDILLKNIQPTLYSYDLGLLIEESQDDGSRFVKDYFWCIDPLDGTLPFSKSQPGYAVSLALVNQSGQSVLGIIYDPLKNILYRSIHQQGTLRNNQPWKINAHKQKKPTRIDHGGAVLNACWVLEQAPAYFMKDPKPEQGGGCIWDYAATTCLFKEMGAFVSDRSGRSLKLNPKGSPYMNQTGVIYASSPEIAQTLGITLQSQ